MVVVVVVVLRAVVVVVVVVVAGCVCDILKRARRCALCLCNSPPVGFTAPNTRDAQIFSREAVYWAHSVFHSRAIMVPQSPRPGATPTGA